MGLISLRRAIDLFVCVIFLAPVLLVIAISACAILYYEGAPVFYVSARVGHHEKTFKMLKLRTMRRDAPLTPTSDSQVVSFVTPIGQFLRKTSIDELPQLFNVIMGSMTLVGPRPCLATESQLIRERRARDIFHLKPGVTGLAQVCGRDKSSMRRKVKYERFYMRRMSVGLHLIIAIRTVKSVLIGHDVSH